MLTKNNSFLVLANLFILNLFSQNTTIAGFVTDALTGERLIGVSVYDSIRLTNTFSNNFGFYSLSLPIADTFYIKASITGYKPLMQKIEGKVNQSINIVLQAKTELLNEVVITADQPIENKTEMSTLQIPMKQIKQLPTFIGEADVLKAFQLMPGVQSGKEGSNALYVRGGSPDQNLILLDDIPLYYVSHLGGFVSIFDANVISNVKLIKGGFPARYGGRLSSVVDIRMKDGNENKRHGEFSIGTLVSKLSLDGPLNKNTTYVISFRRSFLDLFTRGFNLLMRGGKQDYWYALYDANIKVCNRVSDKDRLFFSFYSGSDKVGAKGKTDNMINQQHIETSKYSTAIKWGNVMANMRWNHIYNDNLFSNLTIGYTRFKYTTAASGQTIDKSSNAITQRNSVVFFSEINDLVQKMDFDYYPNAKHQIRFGNSSSIHFFNPSVSSYSVRSLTTNLIDTTMGKDNKVRAYEFNIYCEDEYTLTSNITVNAGLHLASYTISDKSFFSVQPRITSNYRLIKNTALKASFAVMQQPLHLLSSSTAGFPTDLWVPATRKAVPEKSWQTAVGIARTILFNKWIAELSIEGYYKRLENLIEFQEGANFFSAATNFENKVATGGKGTVYGVEFLLQKKEGRFTGWIGYTLSKNTRQFVELNRGLSFPYRYDRTHDLSIVANYERSEKLVFSCSWVYGTGNAVTLASQKYTIQNYNYDYQSMNGATLINFEDAHLYSSRNGYRMPAFHKLDLSVNFIKKLKKGVRTWNISVYNAYSRQNAYLLFFKTENNRTKLYQLSLFPIIPSVCYQYKF